MKLVTSFAVLLLFQLIGTVVQQTFALVVPGAVIGMVLLFAFLVLRRHVPRRLDWTSQGLLHYMPILFVPAGVGVMQEFGLIAKEWLPISASVILSSVITIAFTGIVMQICLRHFTKKPAEELRHE